LVIVVAQYLQRFQNKLEQQYAAKRDAHVSEVMDLKQQLEMKSNEIRSLNASIDSLKSVNEELKVCFSITTVFRSTFLAARLCRDFGWHRGWQELGRERPGP
jgi:hypothetical protein